MKLLGCNIYNPKNAYGNMGFFGCQVYNVLVVLSSVVCLVTFGLVVPDWDINFMMKNIDVY